MGISSNIKNNSWITPNLKLSMRDYWDFYLHPGDGQNDLINLFGADYIRTCLLSSFPLTGVTSPLISLNKWSDSVVFSGLTLNNIGLTGMDNGFIPFDKNISGCTEFYNTYTGSTLNIDSQYEYLHISPVTGYTKNDLEYIITSATTLSGTVYNDFRGGFYQGFFKLQGYDYQVLPLRAESEFSFEFYLNPRPNDTFSYRTINDVHPNNKGIFFYLGSRAENKFYDIDPIHTTVTGSTGSTFFSSCPYQRLETYSGLNVLSHTTDIVTDNKFIYFNRTCTGVTINNYDPNAIYVHEVSLIKPKNDNKFLDYDRSCSGKTIWSDLNTPPTDYDYIIDPKSDIIDNAFALRVKDDGRIGYRLLTRDCAHNLVIEEEYSEDSWVLPNDWNHVVVRMIFDRRLIECGPQRKFKLYFYVNGYLKFISKELPEQMMRGLTCYKEKQEAVPYNISIGGGALGLMEAVYNGYSNDYVQNLDIENNFCGSFIGGISNFRLYTCQFDYTKVYNNYLYYINNFN